MFDKFLAAALLIATAGAASAQSFICTIKTNEGGFIPQQLAMQIDDGAKTAVVYDPIIHFAKKAPIPAKFRKTNKGEWEMRWRLTVPANPREARLKYRATFDPANKTVSIAAEIRHATNFERGAGQCVEQSWSPGS